MAVTVLSMGHKHPVYDTDKHFVIDPITKQISTDSPKLVLAQKSHNSERITFEIPKEVEGHDMSVCNLVEIHYQNIDAKNIANKNIDIYKVTDLQPGTGETEDTVFCSWLVGGSATAYAGGLIFAIHFACIADDGTIDYSFPTLSYSGITIGETTWNSETIANEYPVILAQFEARIAALEQADSVTSWNDLKDKPFGEVAEEIYGEITFIGGQDLVDLNNFPALDYEKDTGKTFILVVDGVQYPTVAIGDADLESLFIGRNSDSPIVIEISDGGTWILYNNMEECNHTLRILAEGFKTIDEKYIPETIARKTDITWENLPDKPFGEGFVEIYGETTFVGGKDWTELNDFPILDYDKDMGKPFIIVVDGVQYPTISDDPSGMGNLYLGHGDCPITIEVWDGYAYVMGNDLEEGNHTLSILGEGFKTLDEAYIPETIARKADIPEGFSGSWNDLTDKPFGEVVEEIYRETTITLTESEPIAVLDDTELVPGETYIFVVNGIEYKTTAIEDMSMGWYEIGRDVDCPISIQYDPLNHGRTICETIREIYGTYTIRVLKAGELKLLDEKYLPYKTEEWVFELEDGSTVTRQVVVK